MMVEDVGKVLLHPSTTADMEIGDACKLRTLPLVQVGSISNHVHGNLFPYIN